MLVDFRLTWSVIFIIALSVIFPFVPALELPLFNGKMVTLVETIQAFLLLGFAVFSYVYMRPMDLSAGKKYFWIWAVLWWLVLFGRSTSWGRDYFPELPKGYFRAISVMLIGSVLFMLFSSELRSEVATKFRTTKIFFWQVVLVVGGLLISDCIEHERALCGIFLHDYSYKDLIEELYEFPLIFGLFMISYVFMRQDRKPVMS